MFGATNRGKDNDKSKYVHSGYGIAFDWKGEWKVVIFGLDNSSSFHTDNCNNNLLVLVEGDTFGINGSFGAPEKRFSINFSKAKTKFCLRLLYNGDNS